MEDKDKVYYISDYGSFDDMTRVIIDPRKNNQKKFRKVDKRFTKPKKKRR